MGDTDYLRGSLHPHGGHSPALGGPASPERRGAAPPGPCLVSGSPAPSQAPLILLHSTACWAGTLSLRSLRRAQLPRPWTSGPVSPSEAHHQAVSHWLSSPGTSGCLEGQTPWSSLGDCRVSGEAQNLSSLCGLLSLAIFQSQCSPLATTT